MTREEQLDWLCRLRSEIYVYMPKEWLTPMKNALDMAIEALEQEPTTKNDLVDAISREDALMCLTGKFEIREYEPSELISIFLKRIRALPSVTPQEPKVDWDELKRKIFMEVDGGTDDKWLRYADVCDNISNSIDDFKADLPSVTPQEPKPMVEIDLYSVIKQKYIEREVLDKIRAEIQAIIGERNLDDYDFCSGLIVARKIIDKYKTESEPQGSEKE